MPRAPFLSYGSHFRLTLNVQENLETDFFSFKRSTDGRSSCRPLTSGNQLLYMDHDEVCSHNLIVKLYYFREFFMEYLLVFLSFFFIFDDVLIISYLLYFCQHPKNILL